MSNTTILILAIFLFILAVILFVLSTRKEKATTKALKNKVSNLESAMGVLDQLYHDESDRANKLDKQLDGMELISVEYNVSDSDLLKYKNEKQMENSIRTKLAMLIANDIVRRFGAPEKNDKKYEYVFFVVKNEKS